MAETTNDFICRNCGQKIDSAFVITCRSCPSLTGCGSTNIRPINQFDEQPPHVLAELLADMVTRIEDLEVAIENLSLETEQQEMSDSELAEKIRQETGLVEPWH